MIFVKNRISPVTGTLLGMVIAETIVIWFMIALFNSACDARDQALRNNARCIELLKAANLTDEDDEPDLL